MSNSNVVSDLSDKLDSLGDQPLHSYEAERAVLGAILLEGTRGGAHVEAWKIVDALLSQNDFYDHEHQMIFGTLVELAANNKPQDAISVANAIELNGDSGLSDVYQFLTELASSVPNASNLREHAVIVLERSVQRQLIAVSHEIADGSSKPGSDGLVTLVCESENKLHEIKTKLHRNYIKDQGKGLKDIRTLLCKTVERIDELFQADGGVTGIPTGFTDFDDKTSGLQPGQLVIVAGRPSMGKTAFAMNIVENVVVNRGAADQQEPPVEGESEQQKTERLERNRNKGKVAVFSLEMPSDELVMRMLSSLGRVPLDKIRSGDLTDQDWPRLISAVQMLDSDNKLFIDDCQGVALAEVGERARQLKKDHGLEMIVIDYLQLIQIRDSSGDNRAAEISEISRSLKSLAKELNVPVIALSQLNRSLEARSDKRPVLSDLRESGLIEDDADLLMFLYRDEVYDPESPDEGTVEVIIRKQCNGPIGTCRLDFYGQYTRFENYASEFMAGDLY